jgi:hypothetical protein
MKIEKDVPVPPRPVGGRPGKYDVVGQMEVGDSFLVPAGKCPANPSNLLPTIYVTAFRHGMRKAKFEVRRVDGGMRVWRTA